MSRQVSVTVHGGFHNVPPITLRARDGRLSIRQVDRLADHMCGVAGCLCGPRHGWEVSGVPDADLYAMIEAAVLADLARARR